MSLDYYCRNLSKLSARALVLSSGKPVVVRFDKEDRYTKNPRSHQEITELLLDSAPSSARDAVRQGRAPEPFLHVVDGEEYRVTVTSKRRLWRVLIMPEDEAPLSRAAPPSTPSPGDELGGDEVGDDEAPTPVPVEDTSPPLSEPFAHRRSNLPPERAEATLGRPRVLDETLVSHGLKSSPVDVSVAERLATPERSGVNQWPLRMPSNPPPDPEIERELDSLLKQMVDLDATDVHLTAGLAPRCRIAGELRPLPGAAPMGELRLRRTLFSVMPRHVREHFERVGDAEFNHVVEGVARYRINLARDCHGMFAVVHRIPLRVRTVEELGLPDPVLQLCYLRTGLVLLAGDAASGKEATLATLVDHMNNHRADHVITLEDPVELVHPDDRRCLIHQREVGPHTGSFARAMRAAQVQDPDILVVSDLPDLETIVMALQMAEAGKLVFAALPSRSVTQAIDRMIDPFPDSHRGLIRTMVAASLRAVVAQTLCMQRTGGGRVPAYEVLVCNRATARLILDEQTDKLGAVMQSRTGAGNFSLNDSLVHLVRRGLVSPEEAYLRAVDKDGLVAMLRELDIEVGRGLAPGEAHGA